MTYQFPNIKLMAEGKETDILLAEDDAEDVEIFKWALDKSDVTPYLKLPYLAPHER